ncbi:MAG: phosphate signaling complex protein PhoU [Firmicutes bacterium]|nr:phosphate signaling complex protein PhoU [Bacillota bacterium]
MRKYFDRELEALNTGLVEMGAQIESAIENAVKALETSNADYARKAIELDSKVNSMEKDIESRCLRLLLQQHPVASDLRLISVAMKMITDMERIGDQAADIAEITLRYEEKQFIKELVDIPKMAQAAIKMVHESIDAFVKRDLALAKSVILYDDFVDELFTIIRNDLIELIHADKNNGEQALDLFMITKYLERIADHAVNIAEWVVFSMTGQHKDYE